MRCVYRSLAILLTVLTAFTIQALSQRVVISKKIYSALQSKTTKLSDSGPKRIKYEWQTMKDGIVVNSSYDIFEEDRKGRMREYNWKSDAGVISTTEEIYIGDDECYAKKNGAAWDRSCGFGGGRIGPGLQYFPNQFDDYSIESVFLDGATMQLLEHYTVFQNSPMTFTDDRIWIRGDGKVHGRQSISGTLNPREESERFVSSYEYDPNVKIEPPIK